ncbi:MAG TPA: hypothetical protein VIU61_25775 [Kofleriaceae bacterium]
MTDIGESSDELVAHGGDDDDDDDGDHVRSWSSQGNPIPETGEFFQAQGTNGRSCGTCHSSGDGWAFNVDTANEVFDATGGLDPLFSRLDADIPTLTDAQIDAMTVEERRGVFTQLLQARFTRNITAPATRDFDLTAVSDPFGVSSTATQRMWFFRRSMPTANFKSHTVSWDSANTVGTVLRDGLIRQARGNVTGAQEGPAAPDAVIFEIVDFEMAISNAAVTAAGVGRLDKHGGKGGPKNHQNQPLVAGRFDLYDAFQHSHNPHKRAIYRGQELFNNGDHNGKKCGGCHNAANSGQNVGGALFNVGASNPQFATSDMAVFTFTQRVTGTTVVLTDPGRGGRNGVFADLGKFKTPTLRGLLARDAYFHNGAAGSLEEVVDLYETTLGFDFTAREERDLVAFLTAL